MYELAADTYLWRRPNGARCLGRRSSDFDRAWGTGHGHGHLQRPPAATGQSASNASGRSSIACGVGDGEPLSVSPSLPHPSTARYFDLRPRSAGLVRALAGRILRVVAGRDFCVRACRRDGDRWRRRRRQRATEVAGR